MTHNSAFTTANVLIASAGVAAAYVVLTRPPLRRLVFRVARLWLSACATAYLAEQVRQTCRESVRPI